MTIAALTACKRADEVRRALSPAAAAAAPLSAAEWDRFGTAARSKGYSTMSADEANQRVKAIQAK